jgi:hypothetical protein
MNLQKYLIPRSLSSCICYLVGCEGTVESDIPKLVMLQLYVSDTPVVHDATADSVPISRHVNPRPDLGPYAWCLYIYYTYTLKSANTTDQRIDVFNRYKGCKGMRYIHTHMTTDSTTVVLCTKYRQAIDTREKRDLERKRHENIDIAVEVVRCVHSKPASTVDSVLRSDAIQNLLCWLACSVLNGPPPPKFQIPPSQLRQRADRAAGLSVKGL